MDGQARVSGHESFMPSRRLQVARSYVEGLEKIRDRYNHLQADHVRLNSEAITLASHVLTLQQCLGHIIAALDMGGIPINEKTFAVAEEILDNSQATLDEIYACPCGHAKFDHDEEGCTYLHCRKVCA